MELTAVGIHFRHPNASSADYAGHFLSSDDELNRIWYQGAYTNDTDMVPIGAVPNQTIPVILDGAKRDRRPWIGDLLVQGRTAFSSLGFGAKGSDYIKSTIAAFGATQAADGSIFGHIGNWTRLAAHRRVLLDELLDVLRPRPGVVLPVLGRRAVRRVPVPDDEERARLQPGARGSEQRPAHHRQATDATGTSTTATSSAP